MPLYTFRCGTCLRRYELYRTIEKRNEPHTCSCGASTTRQIEAPAVLGDYPEYNCPITGQVISGRRAHEENLRRHGCRVLEPGEREEVTRRRRQLDQALETSLEQTIDKEIAALPSEKRDRLAAEMEGGLTAEVVRTAPN